MKDILNKKFWIIFLTINAAFVMLFISFSYWNYSLILGFISGFVVFIIYILSISSCINKIFSEIKDINKKHKKRIGILFLFLINIFILALILAIFMINYLYRKYIDTKTIIAFYPINFIVFVIPFLIFIVSTLITYLKIKKQNINNEYIERKNNG